MSKSIVLTCKPALSAERVWRAFTTDQGLAAWFWPMWPDTDYRFEPRAGGHYAIRCETQQAGVHGTVTEAVEPRRLGFTWTWDGTGHGDESDADRVLVEILPTDVETLVTVTHELRHPERDEGPVTQGWTDCLDRLERLT